MTIQFSFKKKEIEILKENAKERLWQGYDYHIKAQFDLDLEWSKKKLMRLKKSDLCDIIISAFVLEQQESVKYFLADKLRRELWED
jgi:hypothetical protein